MNYPKQKTPTNLSFTFQMMMKIIIILLVVILPTMAQNNKVIISTPENSIIYKKIGRLFPSLNYGHIRTTVDMSTFPNITHRICSSAKIFKDLITWTDAPTLDLLHDNIASKFQNASYSDKYPSRPFQLQMRAMVGVWKCVAPGQTASTY